MSESWPRRRLTASPHRGSRITRTRVSAFRLKPSWGVCRSISRDRGTGGGRPTHNRRRGSRASARERVATPGTLGDHRRGGGRVPPGRAGDAAAPGPPASFPRGARELARRLRDRVSRRGRVPRLRRHPDGGDLRRHVVRPAAADPPHRGLRRHAARPAARRAPPHDAAGPARAHGRLLLVQRRPGARPLRRRRAPPPLAGRADLPRGDRGAVRLRLRLDLRTHAGGRPGLGPQPPQLHAQRLGLRSRARPDRAARRLPRVSPSCGPAPPHADAAARRPDRAGEGGEERQGARAEERVSGHLLPARRHDRGGRRVHGVAQPGRRRARPRRRGPPRPHCRRSTGWPSSRRSCTTSGS